MTEPENSSIDASGQHLIAKESNALKLKNSLLKTGFKLSLNRKNGYKTIHSKSNEDLSTQKLIIQNVVLDCDENELENRNEAGPKRSSPNVTPARSPTSETWFNTWPERCDKIKSGESSPERAQTQNINTQNTSDSKLEPVSLGNKLTLNEALKNISLAYSPVTKKLHFLDNFSNNDVVDESLKKHKCKEYDNNFKNTEEKGSLIESLVKENSSPLISPCKNLGHRRLQEGSFSSTISNLSEPSTSGSLIGSEDRSLSNFDEDLYSDEKPRRKSITQFFTKNVFSWKSDAGSTGVWKIFGKGSGQTNGSPAHSVASSTALIQLKRPSSLPAKTLEEEQRHAQQYNEILVAAKKKEAKSSAAKEKQKKLQLQQEEQLANAAKHFAQQVIPNWALMEKHKKTQELWWQGLPSSVRGKVWKLAIGNELNVTPQLYEICLIRAQNRLNSPEPPQSEIESDQESSMDVIELDISRTFPNLCIFQEGGPYSDVLHSLLAAYVCFRPDVGYVQGMSYIAAVLILNMEPCDAFICFANLLNQPLHLSAFTLNQSQMRAYYDAYDRVFSSNLPKLYRHFCDSGLTADLYLLDWIYTVFAKAMPLDVACRVWDVYLRDGHEFIFRTALGILHLYQSSLLTMDFLHGAQFLTKLPEDMSSDQLFKSIQCVCTNIGKVTFSQIVEKCALGTSMTDLYR